MLVDMVSCLAYWLAGFQRGEFEMSGWGQERRRAGPERWPGIHWLWLVQKGQIPEVVFRTLSGLLVT